MKNSIKELATQYTTASDVQGASNTFYGLQPALFLKEIVNAAKDQHFFLNWINVQHAPKGIHDVVIPKRSNYLANGATSSEDVGDMQFTATEPTTADITFTELDNLTSVTVTPVPRYAGVALSNYAINTNSINLVEAARDELSYAIGEKIDRYIATQIGNAADGDGTLPGAQTLYGGDATTDATLATGDTITTDLIAKGYRYLTQKQCYYWTGGTETASGTKNPWLNTQDDPFVLFIAPAQQEVFHKDSQFVNAAEYGSDKIIHTGEIGTNYLGIRIIVTNNVEQVAAIGTSPDDSQTGGTTTTGAAMTRCILMKPKKACALVYGRDPRIEVFDYKSRDQTRVSLVCDYAASVIHDDAIVFIDVANS